MSSMQLHRESLYRLETVITLSSDERLKETTRENRARILAIKKPVSTNLCLFFAQCRDCFFAQCRLPLQGSLKNCCCDTSTQHLCYTQRIFIVIGPPSETPVADRHRLRPVRGFLYELLHNLVPDPELNLSNGKYITVSDIH